MKTFLNELLDHISEFISNQKGLLPITGIILIIINWIFQLVISESWLAETNLLLHVGVIFAVLGFLLAWAL